MNTKTPETDKAMKYWPSENAELVDADFARKLEIEKNELKEELNNWKTKLSLLGDDPEKVWSVWRRQMYATQKYIRQMVIWREKAKNPVIVNDKK